MQILWKGHACFSITAQFGKQEQVRLVIDPFDASLGLNVPSLEADIVLSTHDHYDHNNIKAVRGDPFVVAGPGEYEIKGVTIRGIPSFHDEKQGAERGTNTIYLIEAEGMRLCHLGDFGQAELTPDQVSKIGNVDILFVPVGGVYTIGAKAAANIVHEVEPRIVVPMHYMVPKLKVKLESVDAFLREIGAKNTEVQPKLNVKVRDLPVEETKVVVLNS